MRRNCQILKKEVTKLSEKCETYSSFPYIRIRRAPKVFDELDSDERFQGTEKRFYLKVLYRNLGTATAQLKVWLKAIVKFRKIAFNKELTEFHWFYPF